MLFKITLVAMLLLPLSPVKKEYPLIDTKPLLAIELSGGEMEDAPETIYELFSEEEIEILFRIVEAECTGQPIETKMHVANVVLNRINSTDFPDTIKDVVFQKVGNCYQFSPVSDGRYWDVVVTEETIKACEDIFFQEDTTRGALFFCNKGTSERKNSNWMDNKLIYIFTDEANHSFYK